MNHQIFETWILDDLPRAEEDAQALQAHLERCESCRSLQERVDAVSRLFAETPLPAPAPGFSDRWLAALKRQQSARRARQRRQVWGVAALLGGGALLALLLLGVQFFHTYGSCLGFALDVFSRISGILILLVGVQSMVVTLAHALAGWIPVFVWVSGAAALYALMLLWVALMAKLIPTIKPLGSRRP